MPRERKRKYHRIPVPLNSDSDVDLPYLESLPKIRAPVSDESDNAVDGTQDSDPHENVTEGFVQNDNILVDSESEVRRSESEEDSTEEDDLSSNYPNSSCQSIFSSFLSSQENDYAEEEQEQDLDLDLNNFDHDSDDYLTILKKLSDEWLVNEIDHTVSHVCSDKFWSIALKWMHRLFVCKEKQKIKRKIPQFKQIRLKLHEENSPKVNLNIGYVEKETGNITVVQDDKTPRKSFPPNKFNKLFEIASVDVKHIADLHAEKCPRHNKDVSVSVDGVSESLSTSVSLDVITTKFNDCREIYPIRILRPTNGYKISNSDQLKITLDDLVANNCIMKKFVADKLKRSDIKCTKGHSAYYPCEYCTGKGTKILTSKVQEMIDIENKHHEKQIEDIEKQIKLLHENDESESSKKNIEMLETLLLNLKKSKIRKSSQIVWPASSRNSELRCKEDILGTIARLENGEDLTLDESKGIIGRSVLLWEGDSDFDYILDSPAEYMHSTCLGLIKRLTELTFAVGCNRPRITKRKLCSASSFNLLIIEIKMPREFGRRARELDFAVYKAQEFRNLCCFFLQ